LIYTSLLALLHLQTRLDSSSYNAITDNVYGNLITEIRKHKPEMDANSIGDFVEKRFQVLLPEIQIITEGLGHAIPATIYSLFYKAPLAEHINTEVPNLIEIVPFTKTLLEVTNNVIGQYEKL